MELQELIAQAERQTVTDDPLARVAAARDLCAELSVLGDQVVDHFVDAARREGCSWAQIGSVLGVSRQGAQQRYGGLMRRVPLVGRRGPSSPVTRFGPDTRRAVVEAQAAARAMAHDHVDTEHLLLGLLSAGPDATGTAVLTVCGLDRAGVEREVTTVVRPGTDSPGRHIPFSPGAKKALELSLREALALRAQRIGTEHLLLALLRERKGVAAQVLAEHGIDRDRVRVTMRSLVDEAPAE